MVSFGKCTKISRVEKTSYCPVDERPQFFSRIPSGQNGKNRLFNSEWKPWKMVGMEDNFPASGFLFGQFNGLFSETRFPNAVNDLVGVFV